MNNLKKNYGWVLPDTIQVNNYLDDCISSYSDDKIFENFKKLKGYRIILEGGPKNLFDTFLDHIDNSSDPDLFFNNLEKFRINDSVGNPDIYEESRIGEFSGTTLKYAFNAIEIINFIKNHGAGIDKVKKIVEIGGGYGGLCLILSGFIEFDSYTLIDLPEVCRLIEKYLSKFPHLEGKVNTISCNDLNESTFDEIDFAIAISSLGECNLDTQLKYFSTIIKKSSLSYIVRNLDSWERFGEHKETINSLDDTFLVDDTERVEPEYSSQIAIYIKRTK